MSTAAPHPDDCVHVEAGQFVQPARRAAFHAKYGWTPKGHVFHTCGNQLCVNIKHLFAGARAATRTARLTDEINSTVRALDDCGLGKADIALQVNLSRNTVARILAGGRSE